MSNFPFLLQSAVSYMSVSYWWGLAVLLDMKGKFTMWKPNASRLSYNLVVLG